MRCAICFAVLVMVCMPHAAIADPLRIDIVALKREYEQKHAEALKRIDPESLLDAPWAHASFKNRTLCGVLTDLSENLGHRLLIDRVALGDAGVDAVRIDLDLRATTTRAALAEALKLSGAAAKGIRAEVIDDLVAVSNEEHLAFLKRWFAPAVAAANAKRAARNPLTARIGAVALPLCNEGITFGLTISNVTLAEALNEVAEEAAVRVDADWDSLKACGIDGHAEVNGLPAPIEVPNVSIASALAMLFHHYEGFWSCKLHEREGKIVISADRK